MGLNGIKTNINELKCLILEYREQLKRMKVTDIENYPLILNIKNESGIEDDWSFDLDGNGQGPN
jgi:hypothetical protein